MNNQDRDYSIIAFLVGGLLGASATMLFNPKNKTNITKEIKLKAENYLAQVRAGKADLIKNSRSSAELLKRKAEDIMDTVQQYALGKFKKPVSLIEKEIEGFKVAIAAAKTSYALNPKILDLEMEENSRSIPSANDFEDETLPKNLGMGKGRNRRSYSS